MAERKGKPAETVKETPASTESMRFEYKDWIDALPTMEELLKRDSIRIDAFMRSGFTESQIVESLESRSKMVQEFFAQNVELLETKDKEIMEKTSSMIHGLGTKYAMRVLLVIGPLGYAFNYGWNRYQRVSLYLEDKYADRLVAFFKFKDPTIVNPEFKRPTAAVVAAVLYFGHFVSVAEPYKVLRAAYVHLKFYAVVYVLFAPLGDEVAPRLIDIFFPMARLNLLACTHLIYPIIGGWFSDDIGVLISWNVLLVLVFLFINFCLCDHSLKGVAAFCMLQGADLQFTISAFFCGWKGELGYWRSTLCFSMTIQWFLVAVVIPSTIINNRRYYEGDASLPKDFKENDGLCWLVPFGEVSGFIAWLHVCAIWLSSNLAIQVMVSAGAVWILVWVHEMNWPFESRHVNQVVGDLFKGLWLLVIWLIWRNPIVFGVIVLFALRKVAWH